MRSALHVLTGLVALTSLTSLTSSVAADDDYKPAPITRHWRVRVSINEYIETHGKTQYEGLDDVINSNASWSFVVGTTDDDLTGDFSAFSQDPTRDLKGVEGTGSYHQKQTFTTAASSDKKFRMIDGNLDPKTSRVACTYQSTSWECTVQAAFPGQQTWDPSGGIAPSPWPGSAMAIFGGGIGIHQNENGSKAMKLPHDRFTFTTGQSIPSGAGGTHTLKASVDVEPLESVGYEAVFVPDAGYEQWLPEGPPVAPDTHQPTTIGLHLELRDARTHAPVAKSFRANFILDSSKLVGDCMNYPAAGSSPPEKPDVYFEAAKNRSGTVTSNELSLDLADGKGGAAVVVSSRDWGGYAKLRAHVVISGGGEVDAVVGAGGGKVAGATFLAIPKDDDENHIADAWDKTVKGKRTSLADDEPSGGWNANGDGYTLFEEYRGFIDADPNGTVMASKNPKRQHERFDPNKRDVLVGIAVNENILGLATAGIATWAQISNVAVHYVADKSLMGKTSEDYDANYPRRADLWGDGHDDLFGKPQMGLWVQSLVALGKSTHANPTRPEKHFDGEVDETQTNVFGHLRDVQFVVINLKADAGTVDASICDVNPDCVMPPGEAYDVMRAELVEWHPAMAALFSLAELRQRAAWGKANQAELERRFTQFVFIHELGHAVGAYHHGQYVDPLHQSRGEPTCPMRYWHIGKNYREVADFVGNKWNLKTAPDGSPWRWCKENVKQMGMADWTNY